MKLTELTEEEKLKINELRERTGEPRMECIKALSQCDWNVEQSIGWMKASTFRSYIR